MIIVCKNSTETEIKNLTDKFEDLGFRTHLSTGTETTIIGLATPQRLMLKTLPHLTLLKKFREYQSHTNWSTENFTMKIL